MKAKIHVYINKILKMQFPEAYFSPCAKSFKFHLLICK